MSTEVVDTVALPAAADDAEAKAKRPAQRTKEGPLIPVPTKLPAALRNELRAFAEKQGVTLSAFVRTTLETALRGGVAGPPRGVAHEASRSPGRAKWSRRIGLRLALEDLRRAEAYAARTGLRKATALAEMVHLGLESAEARDGIPSAHADAILRVLHALEAAISQLGPALFGTLLLVAFSVARDADGRITEDELLTQARLAGDDEWARIVDEMAHADQEKD